MKILKITTLAILAMFTVSCSSTKDTVSNDVEESINESVDEAISDLEDAIEVEFIAKNVSAKEFKVLIEAGKGLLLDVRTPNEVASGKIEGATNLDFYGSTFKADLDKLDKTKAVYVYCRSGNRSGKAMKQMKDLGFTQVYNLMGGYSNWPYK